MRVTKTNIKEIYENLRPYDVGSEYCGICEDLKHGVIPVYGWKDNKRFVTELEKIRAIREHIIEYHKRMCPHCNKEFTDREITH